MSLERRFNLDGVAVEVRVQSPALLEVIGHLLTSCASPDDAGAGPTISVSLRDGPRPATPAGPSRFAFPPMRAYARGGDWLLLDDFGCLEVSPDAGTIDGVIRPGASLRECARFASLTFWVALLECLRGRGRYLVHAAGAIDPNGDLVLLVGPSGVGKTTAALALLELGWTVLGDDLLFLELDGADRLSTVAHRREFHVDEALSRRRPHLGRFLRERQPWEPQDKRRLDVEGAFPGRVQRRAGAPARIYFPELSSQASFAAPIAPREALLRLFPHSCFVGVKPDLAVGHLQALRLLVDRAPAARLVCGPDLLSAPSLHSILLEGDRCRFAASA
jgi:hypothetical protein